MRININKVIEDAVIDAIQRHSVRILDKSQETVPIDTGELRASGRSEETDTGAEVVYDAPHARDVEFGREKEDVSSEVHEVYVRSYRKKDGTLVKGHSKVHKGRTVKFKPKNSETEIIRTLTEIPERSGVYFLTNAVLEELPSFIEDLSDALEESDWGEQKIDVTLERGGN